MPTKAILTDIEGTTSAVSFVFDVLFPYAAKHLPGFVREHAEEGVRVSVTYYVADERKEGGSYHVLQDEVKHVDALRRQLLFRGGEEVPLSSIVALEVDGGALED